MKHKKHLKTVWLNIKKRCMNPHDKSFADYGGRGIILCNAWHDFDIFLKDMGTSYKKGLQIDRINNNLGYFKSNCQWVTPTEQANNKRNNHLITFRGKTLTLAQWSRKLKIPYSTLICRINKRKWSINKSFTTPPMPAIKERIINHNGESHNITKWSKITGIPTSTILYRFKKGLSTEKILAKPTKRKPQQFKDHKVSFNGKSLMVSKWSIELKIPYTTLIARFKAKWPIEKILSTKPK